MILGNSFQSLKVWNFYIKCNLYAKIEKVSKYMENMTYVSEYNLTVYVNKDEFDLILCLFMEMDCFLYHYFFKSGLIVLIFFLETWIVIYL